MLVALNLNPEIEADLQARAQGAGLSLDQFVSQQLEVLAHTNTLPPPSETSKRDSEERWEAELDQWLDSFPQHPLLPDEAIERENCYPDRW